MKWTKILGIVLLMHLLVISTLLVNPGCKWLPQKKTATQPVEENKWKNTSFVETSKRTATSYGKSEKPWRTKIDNPRDKPTPPILIERFEAPGESNTEAFNGIGFEQELISSPSDTLTDASSTNTPSEKIHSVTKGDSLWKIAKQYNVSLNELLQANALGRDSILSIGQEIIIPESTSQTSSTLTAQNNTTEFSYKVRSGDSLSKIAQRYQTTVAAIKQNNGLTSDTIRIGQTLNIPGEATSTVIEVPSQTSVETPSPNNIAIPEASEAGTHIVRPGETPGEIAKQYNISTQELMAINAINDPRKLRVGTKLIVDPANAPDSTPELSILPEIKPQEPILPPPPSTPASPWRETTTALDEAAPIIPVQEDEEEQAE